jgi:hypothetical protein
MKTYIVYTRSRIASTMLYLVYSFVLLIAVALILDDMPDAPDVVSVIAVVLVVLVPIPLAQLSSRSRIRVVLDNDLILFHTLLNNSFVPDIPATLSLDDIALIDLNEYPVSGCFLLLRLKNSNTIKLYPKHSLFSKNAYFFDLCVALRVSLDNYQTAKKNATYIEPTLNRYVPAAEQRRMHFEEAVEPEHEAVVTPDAPSEPEHQHLPEPETVREATPAPEPKQRYAQPIAGQAWKGANQQFVGSQFASWHGLIIWAGIIFFLVFAVLLSEGVTEALISSVLFAVVWVPLFSNALHYFELMQDSIVVRKHNMPWVRKAYYISEIKEAKLDAENSVNSLMLVFKNFGFENYKAPGLSDADWLRMKAELELRGVVVKSVKKYNEAAAMPVKKHSPSQNLVVGLVVYAVFVTVVYTILGALHLPHELRVLTKMFDALFIVMGVVIFLVLFVPWVAARGK